MSSIVTKTYTFTNSTASSHFSKSGGMNLGQAGLVSAPLILWESNSGTATMNATGKRFLYPKAGVHPFKADYSFYLWNATDSNLTSNPSSYMNFYFKIDGTTVYHKELSPGKTSSPTSGYDVITNNTNSAILNSTKSSSITFEITAQKNGLTQMAGISPPNDAQSFIKFYYQQWDLTVEKVGDGWGAIFAPGRVYAGESVDFFCNTGDGCTFHGWYSDANHTNLVSSSVRYTVTASQDLILYPYITRNTLALDNVYVKTEFQLGDDIPGWFKPNKIWYKTLNGWEAQNNTNNLINGNTYRYGNNFIEIRELSSLLSYSNDDSTSFTFNYYPWSHGVLYLKNTDNCILTDWITAENFYCCPMQDGLIVWHDGTYFSDSRTVKIQLQPNTYSDKRTINITISFITFERDIQFKDLNGNLYKEKLICTSPFTVTTPSGSGYSGFTGWREIYCGTPTGRILQLNQSYWDVGWNNEIYYEPVIN